MILKGRTKYYQAAGEYEDVRVESFSLLFKTYVRNVGTLKSNEEILQALHNYYAKKLKIPAIQIEISDDLSCDGLFDLTDTLDEYESNAFIKIGKFLEYENGFYYSINVVLHETKHAHQAYIFHKFLQNGTIPSSSHEQLLLLVKVLTSCNCVDDVFYCLNPEELDSYIYEIIECSKLVKRYPYLQHRDLIRFRKEAIFKLLYQLEYNKEGINNKYLKQMIKILKSRIYLVLKGAYGEEAKKLAQAIVLAGFNVEESFNYVVGCLNEMCDELILDDLSAKKLGFKTNLSSNGNINYDISADAVNDLVIELNSQYAQFLASEYSGEIELGDRFVRDAVKGLKS